MNYLYFLYHNLYIINVKYYVIYVYIYINI